MSVGRFAAIFRDEIAHSFRRPLFFVLAGMLLLTAFGLSSGQMSISSGDSSVGGTKAWITSEYAQTQTMTYLTLIFLAFFVAIGAGMTLLRDRESKVDPLLHATPLSAGEYVWGRFAALVLGFTILLCVYGAAAAFFNHAVPSATAKEIRGPFAAGNYLVPVLAIGLPFVIFFGGLSMYVGERTRNAVLVFVLPVATLLVCGFFLWTWSPSWLHLGVNRLFQVIEPSADRWLNETHLKVDRGVAYYNREHVGFDLLFWLNRAWVLAAGLAAVSLFNGITSMAHGGVEDDRQSYGLMCKRCLWQAVAVALVLVAML
ncbi:MAG TPA: hypothetical protein VLT84_12170, partial [Acidobacteriota bacterium]|nr:hypothetical protein [Acidobacteriota bacterium]